MISAIQPAGIDLIVEIILMLISGTCFVNGQYFRVACYELRVAGPSINQWPGTRNRRPAASRQ